MVLFLAQDWSSLVGGLPGELAAAVPVALQVVGLFIGILLAYRLVVWMVLG